ncbi:FecR family protein [Chitinophaga agrisoli]|uniref:FecR family protein n=1 Tax=Chitinophaga agrisoli TaxID=2607653 RepID=UPI001661D6EC|nr:FecR domain-containing protein [Chitinophaga agrisoli]
MKTQFTQQQNEYIWQLMYEKIAGIIQPRDERFLEAQLERDECMREAFDALEMALHDEDSLDLERLQQDEDWIDLLGVIKPHEPARRPFSLHRYGKLAIAAAAAGLLFGAGYYLLQRRAAPPAQQAASLPAEKQVLLALADNKTIPLTGQQQDINLGDVQLHERNGTLTFDTRNNFTHSGQHTLVVPEGKEFKLVLSDGSEIWLNAATRLQFPFHFNGSSREITLLSGEAYVKVATNAAQPFIVHAPNSTVQVLGTEFNINTYQPELLRLALVNGAVKIQGSASAMVVKPGMEAVCSDKALSMHPFDPRAVLGWRSGSYFFENASISEICTVLTRNMGIPAVIDNGSAAYAMHFSGIVNKHKPIQELMEDVKNATNIDYYFDKEGVLHFR